MEIRLGEVIKIKHGFAFKGQFFTDEETGLAVLTPGNFSLSGGFQETEKYYTSNDFPKEFILFPGDLIVTMTDLSKDADTIGFSALVPENNNHRYLHNQRIGLVTVFNPNFEKDYIYWLMRSPHYQRTIANSSNGSTVHHTSPDRIYKYRFAIKTRLVQQRIASILFEYDKLIEANNNRIKILEQMAEELYKEWFVRFRFPGYKTAEFENGIPKGWEYIRADKVIYFNPTLKSNSQQEFTIIPMEALSTTSMVLDSSCFIRQATITGKRSQNGDTLFAKITPCLENGKTGFVMGLAEGEIAGGSTEFIVLRSKILTPHYVYCIARSYYFRQTAILSMNGADGRQRVDEGKLKSTKVLRPTKTVLDRFEKIVSPIFDIIFKLTQKNKVLTEQRDLLLPRLMSGKLEV